MTLETVLAEGEAAGISIHSMLGDASSEHYVGYDLMEIYQQSILDIIGNKVGTKKTFKEILEVSPKEYFKEKRDQAYSIFFDADPDKDGNQLDRKTFQSNVKVGDYISTVDRSSREVVMAEFLVKDQEYTIVGELIDQDTRIKGVVKKEIDLNGLLEEVCIYPPFIIGEYPGVWGFEENEIPVTTRDINHKIKEFPLFLSGKVNPGEFTVSIIAKDANDEIFWNKELELSSDSNIFSERIIIDKKPEENLSMEVSVSLKQNKITDLKKMSLRKRKPGLSFFINNVDEALDQMRYIVTDEEYKLVKKAKRKEREKLFYQFWDDRDPTPGTISNELMDQYYYRVKYSNEKFASFQPGWKTDMGMIYILFGPPDDMQRTFGQNTRNTYETWYYYSINRNFSFYDENGFGDFKLTTPYYRAVGW